MRTTILTIWPSSELAAQLAWIQNTAAGQSVMVTMDATSPVTAYRRFCKVLNRKKQAYYLTLYAYIRYYYTAGSIDDTRHVVPRT